MISKPRGRAVPLFIPSLDSWRNPSRQRHILLALRILTIHCIQTQAKLAGSLRRDGLIPASHGLVSPHELQLNLWIDQSWGA